MEETNDYFPRKLEYVEKEKKYKLNVLFIDIKEENDEDNKIVLMFDEKGEFIEAKSQITQSLKNKTLKETREQNMMEAMECKEAMKKTIESLIRPKKKEEMVFIYNEYHEDWKCLEVGFELDGLTYFYRYGIEAMFNNKLECVHRDENGTTMVLLYNIPSLKGIETYIQNHPKMRVKYLNQLAYIASSKNESKEVEQ